MNTMRIKFSFNLAALAVGLIAAHPAVALYKCVDEKGVTHYGDIMPLQCAKKPVVEMSKQGSVVRTFVHQQCSSCGHTSGETGAIAGRDFFFIGGMPPGESLTRDAYAAVQAKALANKLYDGVVFHDSYFEDMPPGFTPSSFRYEISVATDYAIAFGRNRYCARVPLNRSQMRKTVDFLNALNEPYKAGKKIFEWNVLTHSCAHVNHNALAAADIWSTWPMDRPLLISMFDFPVPKNEFVNLMQRTNDLPIDDLKALYQDRPARALLMNEGRLPTQPGALADLGVVIRPNEVYETQSRIIFYDEPITGSFQRRFDAILTQPRYFRLRDNLEYFAELYKRIQAERQPVEKYLASKPRMSPEEAIDFRVFYQRYYAYIEQAAREITKSLAVMNEKPR